jgi:hypothetical protein
MCTEPKVTNRLYNGRKLSVYECTVDTNMINGWVDNPRIDVEKRHFQAKFGMRDLTQDEIFHIMKTTPEFKLAELRDDILKTGLREPLTLSWTGRLLDGNRRFFALKFALESLLPTDPNRQDFERVPAYVLLENASEEDERNVHVEENFSASLKIEWPDYVKAQMVVSAYRNCEGLDERQIAKKFGWTKQKVTDALKIDEIIQSFMSYATDQKDPEDEFGGGLGLSETEAENICAKNYQYFNEAKKSFANQLKTEPDFAIQFFKWIYEGKFSSFPEVRIAYKAWNSPEAKAALMQPDPAAAKSAKAIIDYNARVVKTNDEIEGRIVNFMNFIEGISVAQIQAVSSETRTSFKKIVEAFDKLLNSVG